jgi:hypothetical protein
MNSRDKLKKALNHEQGVVAIDFGSTAVTGMHVSIVEKLRKHYGLEDRPVKVCEPYQMLGMIEQDLREAMGIDVVDLKPYSTIFGFPLGGWKSWSAPWGQELLVPGKFNTSQDQNGVYIYPQGDTEAPPSGHMPTKGFFFDTIIRQEPIIEEKLNPGDNLEEFGPLSEEVLEHYKKEASIAADTGCGVVAGMPGTALGDIALVPAPFLKHPKGIRDVTEWYISTATRHDYIRAMFEKQVEYAISNMEKIASRTGDLIDVAFICGTDFGTQSGTFCSVDTYKSLWKPYYKQINDWIHENTSWKTFKHSCGSVVDFIDEFIDSGFDIFNPVQCSAANMDPSSLAERFGDRIVFWGGGVDTQHTLPFGTAQEVREEVLARCEIFSKGGGFVFNAIHNVQANTPVENVVAMLEAMHEFNGRGNYRN